MKNTKMTDVTGAAFGLGQMAEESWHSDFLVCMKKDYIYGIDSEPCGIRLHKSSFPVLERKA